MIIFQAIRWEKSKGEGEEKSQGGIVEITPHLHAGHNRHTQTSFITIGKKAGILRRG